MLYFSAKYNVFFLLHLNAFSWTDINNTFRVTLAHYQSGAEPHILFTKGSTDREASQFTSSKIKANQLYGANKSPVSWSGQKATWACKCVIFWNWGSDGWGSPCGDDWIEAFDCVWLPSHLTVPRHWYSLNKNTVLDRLWCANSPRSVGYRETACDYNVDIQSRFNSKNMKYWQIFDSDQFSLNIRCENIFGSQSNPAISCSFSVPIICWDSWITQL